ncbi:MAG TPA: hypothetical protein VLI69_01670 [Gammaproteobacteria bacterium]|nr:hypothetical protein [Gammaproteobacteria bacterium]
MKEQANVKVLDYAEAASEMKQANANAEAAQDTPGIMTRLHSWLWYSPASAAPSNGNAESKQAALYANISFDRLFAQNTQDLMNPWHLLAKREDISSHPQCCSLFETLSRLLPGNLCVEKILEKDKKGLTPLHHAIKSRNFELAVKMLDFLNPDQRKEIFAIQHNKNETLLHYICQHGDAHFLGFVLQILGHKEFYKIHRQLPLKHYAANLSIHKNDFEQIMKKYTTLPDFFAYFEKKFDPKKIGQEQSEDYKNRLQDFFDCLTAIQKDISLPAAKASFSAKTYGFGKFQFQGSQEYLEMRLSLDQVKKGELNQFIEFFIDEAIKATAAGSSSFVTEFYAAWMLYQAQTATSEDKNEPLRLGELTGEAAQRFALWANPKQQSVLPTTDAPPSYFEAIASAPPASAPPPYEMPLPSAPYMREQEEQKNPLLNPGIRGL